MEDWTFSGNAGTHEETCSQLIGYLGSGDHPGTLSQKLWIGSGVYEIVFEAAQYVGYVPGVSQPNSFDLRVDIAYEGTFTPEDSEFRELKSGSIGIPSGDHTISFVDKTTDPNLYCYIRSLKLVLKGPLG